jgi:hypothetical protein
MFSRTNLFLPALVIASLLIVAGIAANVGSNGKARSSTGVLKGSATQSQGTQSTAGAESTLYVGGTNSRWQGDDIGAQINTAYAALPPGGGLHLESTDRSLSRLPWN